MVRCELDSHADTCCFGSNSYIMSEELGTTAEVSPFVASLGKISHVPIATIAIAYDCPSTTTTYILLFHQSLFIAALTSHLICPNQLHMNGIVVNECPLQFLPVTSRTEQMHSVVADNLVIPLELSGVTSYFHTRAPTEDEILDSIMYPRIDMTAPSPWDPYHRAFDQTESSL